MRLCLIGPMPPFRGGIARYCYLLARELEKRHDLLVLSYRRQYPPLLYGSKPQIDPDVDRASVQAEFRNLSFDLDSADPRSWRRTAAAIADFNPDAVILPWWVVYWAPMYLYLLRALKRRGIKVLFLCINVFEHEDNLLKKLLTKSVLRQTPSMIVHSAQEKQEILQFHPGARVAMHLLPLFDYPSPKPAKPHRELHLLFFGFVRPYKGLDVLLNAMAQLEDRDVVLKIAGEFWKDEEQYRRQVAELGIAERVEIVEGYIPEQQMGEYFSWADVVVLPYKKSRTSGIIATAYGYGKPVLATRVGGFGDNIDDGGSGRLVAPNDPQALAEGIRWFLEHRDLDFAGNIERFTRKSMSWASLADAIEEKIAAPRR
ncbi:glycosyltransferase [Geomesophilobacter sediminis]|uniref:Glycosyltransferase n=1 Tax=Geomesophilobacter sediminis TaxID=2798584 RepID=A0A8J7SAF3_9BACT|nr:glycosyltransferase [Geomesophilobacter sediminis]MBJ6727296.1 glycosyltransferase [Geomesophilobacter sediminis]